MPRLDSGGRRSGTGRSVRRRLAAARGPVEGRRGALGYGPRRRGAADEDGAQVRGRRRFRREVVPLSGQVRVRGFLSGQRRGVGSSRSAHHGREEGEVQERGEEPELLGVLGGGRALRLWERLRRVPIGGRPGVPVRSRRVVR